MSKSFAVVTMSDLEQENADLRAKLAAAVRCVSTAFPTTPDELTAVVNQLAQITYVAPVEHIVWSGYDDDERSFPLLKTREEAQRYAEQRFREDWVNWGNTPDEIGDLTWSERKAYTDAHDGRAGLFDLDAVNGRTGYVVCEQTVYTTAADAIRADRERDGAL